MIVGGIKYRSQRFNPKSASVTALLLFVAIGGTLICNNIPYTNFTLLCVYKLQEALI